MPNHAIEGPWHHSFIAARIQDSECKAGRPTMISKDVDVYESVSCLACGQLHLVNLRTGKTLGLHGD
jgi:hypothetical protein